MNSETVNKFSRYSKLYKRLERAVISKEFYEAHQLYRSLYNKLNDVDKTETIKILNEGSAFLLKYSQSESGAELATFLVKYYQEKEIELSTDEVIDLKNYFSQMNTNSIERKNFNHLCQKLLKNNQKLFQLYNNWVAVILWKEDQMSDARYHFILSGNGIHTALFLIKYSQNYGYDNQERELFIVQAVLQFLCLGNIENANLAFYVYLKNHPVLKKLGELPFEEYPLLNFTWILLQSVQIGYEEMYDRLRVAYKHHLDRDPSYNDYLGRIGIRYFNQPNPQNKQRNTGDLFSNIFSSFMTMQDDAGTNAGVSNTSTAGFEDSPFSTLDFVGADEMD